jgi:O-6-methylguanine DNA methyltransferase
MDLDESVLSLTGMIPKGRVTSYGELAGLLGNANLARAVGQALKRNKSPLKIPCHRVICSDGRVGGYSMGIPEKIELLKSEGIAIKDNRIRNFEEAFIGASELLSP